MSEVNTNIGQGFVSIVGAGPGSVDLMTLRALDRLQLPSCATAAAPRKP